MFQVYETLYGNAPNQYWRNICANDNSMLMAFHARRWAAACDDDDDAAAATTTTKTMTKTTTTTIATVSFLAL